MTSSRFAGELPASATETIDVTERRCGACAGETLERRVQVTMWRDDRLVVVEDVPARICEACQEQYYDEETSGGILRLVNAGFPQHEAVREITVPVFSLRAAIMLTLVMAFAMPVRTVAQDLDMREIFRCTATDTAGVQLCDEARELVLSNCTSCHTFVPIVMQQFDHKGWDGLFGRHRARVPQLDDEQVDRMKAYLAANFNPEQPPPELPEALLELWTGN
jgi:YgiT-type zinc finger domain-containing protein